MSQIRQETGNVISKGRNGASVGEPDVSSSRTGNDEDGALIDETRQLLKRFLGEYTGLLKPRWRESEALSTMKRVVNEVCENHRYTYNGMINRLSLNDTADDDVRFVSAVARGVFADGITNWGRVASLIAFGASVCRHLKEKGRPNCIELVGEEISAYLLTDQKEWLVQNNSWDGFVDFFRVADAEIPMRNILMAFAGIGATLTLFIVSTR